MDKTPKPGEFYRHFKNRMYQVMAIATHSETGEQMVVYQALYGNFGVYVRPLSMFMDEINLEQYPDAVQKERFQRMVFEQKADQFQSREESEGKEPNRREEPFTGEPSESELMETKEDHVNPMLIKFLDSEKLNEKLELLEQMRGKVGQREIDSISLVMDVQVRQGTVEDQLEDLIVSLKMQQRYDASRLRRR